MTIFWNNSTLTRAKQPPHSPTIVNCTKFSVVVFQERGFLYNQQVLGPGEAISMTSSQTTGNVPLIPYHIHAVIGDERNLPTRKDSVKNLVCVSVIPAAFIAGTIMSAGTMAGPSAALAPMVSGLVVRGMVIDTAALAAGALAASKVQYISDLLLRKHPNKFMAKSQRFQPGKLFVCLTGGLDDGNLTITTMTEKEFLKLNITQYKQPMDTIQDKIHYYVPQLAPKQPTPSKMEQVVDQIQQVQQHEQEKQEQEKQHQHQPKQHVPSQLVLEQSDQQRDDEVLRSEEERQLQHAIAISQIEK